MTIRVLAALLCCSCAAVAAADSVQDELRAAALLENAARPRDTASEREKVREFYARLAQKYPRDANVREAYGAFLWNLEQHDAAFAQWAIGEKLDPKNAGIAFRIGSAHVDGGEIRPAANYLARAARLAPNEAAYRFHFGNVLFLFRRELTDAATPTEAAVSLRALAELRAAATLSPFDEEYARGYAETFFMIPNPDWNEALRAWQHYLEITSNKDLAYSNLARVSMQMGRKREAAGFASQIAGKGFERLKTRVSEESKAAR